jgi:hypothetical protein
MTEYSTGEFRNFRIPPGLGKKIASIGVVIACLIVVAGSTGIVGAGQRGVVLRFGAVTGVIIPLADQVDPDSEIPRFCRLFQQGLASGYHRSHLELPVECQHQVSAEFDRVAKAVQSVAGKQTEQDRMDTPRP